MLTQPSYQDMLAQAATDSSIQGVTASEDVSCLGITRAAITSAMTTLSDYRDGFDDSNEDRDETFSPNVPLDDSGIASDSDDGNRTNREEDPCTDLKLLREKVAKLEEDNDKLKAQLCVYEKIGEFPFSP